MMGNIAFLQLEINQRMYLHVINHILGSYWMNLLDQ